MIGPDEQHDWTDLLVVISGTVDDGLTLRLSGADEDLVAGPDRFAVPTGEIADLMSSLQPTIKRSSRPEVTDPARAAGSRLFETLFGGPRARFYPRVREVARRRGAGLCVRLRMEDPRLAELPWELLYDTNADRSDFLALDPAVCVVRSAFEPGPAPLRVPPSPLRVMVYMHTPGEAAMEVQRLSPLLGGEYLATVITTGAQPGPAGVAVAAPADIWHIGARVVGPTPRPPAAPQIAIVLDDQSPAAATAPGGLDSITTLAGAWASQVPAVVIVPSTVSERAANAFVDSFYRALFAGAAIQDAISAGRRDADYAQPGGRHWASVICSLTGGGPVVDPGVTSSGDSPARSARPAPEPDTDYAGLRGMVAQQNLVALREQAARLGPAAPSTLQRQIDELERAVADRPSAP